MYSKGGYESKLLKVAFGRPLDWMRRRRSHRTIEKRWWMSFEKAYQLIKVRYNCEIEIPENGREKIQSTAAQISSRRKSSRKKRSRSRSRTRGTRKN
jgi:hypothetical protein